MNASWRLDAVLFDLGGTLIVESDGSVAVTDLVAQLVPGAFDDLRELAEQVPLGIVTNTSVMTEQVVRGLLEPTGINQYFPTLVSSFDVGKAKPDPAPLVVAMRRMQLTDAARVLYVGDRDTDTEAATAAGMPFVYSAGGNVGQAVADWLDNQAGVAFAAAAAAVEGRGHQIEAQAAARLASLATPAGALGALETLAVRVCSITKTCPPSVPSRPVVAVFCGDHGVLDEGISPWPQDVTRVMANTIASGRSAVSVLARTVAADVVVVDVGVAQPCDSRVRNRNVVRSTANVAKGAAMTVNQLAAALDVGVATAYDLVDNGADLLVTGDMGIGNTTASAAIIALLAEVDASSVVGRGAGIDDEQFARKAEIVADATARARLHTGQSAIAEVAGSEIAAIAGFIVGALARRTPVLVDGVIALAGLMIAERLAPGVGTLAIAAHRSPEPAATVALDALNVGVLLDLQMRLGEGTGAVLAVPLVQAACAAMNDVATLADLGFGPSD